ncbi:hypothetical protein [Bacillus sp. 03113]|uniref:hypothetical protein n=1 Tax=Bacillus sp. 03113 TaxID=2578211 RepID=UPI001141AAB9|nr:hypothetical protein [Bacillus sp. 03113]
MKQAIYLTPVHREMIKTAMRFYRKGLSGSGKQLFDIAFGKVNKMDKRIELDGMEMVYITQSLSKYGKYFCEIGKYCEGEIYRMQGMEMERIRIYFQYQNGPRVDKTKTNKKTASAATLTA